MTRKDLNQIYDMMDKLDGIKNDQEFIDNEEAKGYKPFSIFLNFKEDKKGNSTGMRKLNITQECLDKIYGLIKKDISSQIKEMSNDIDGMVVVNTSRL